MTPADKLVGLRNDIDQLIASGSADLAAARLGELWHNESSPAAAAFIVSRVEKLRGRIALLPYRVAILRSFTVEPAVPLLRAAAFCYGIDLQVHVGDFNGYMQEILDAKSSAYKFEPDAAILALRTSDCASDLWQDYARMGSADREEAARRVVGTFEQCITSFRERSRATLIIHTLEQPARLSLGVLDSQVEESQAATIRTINRDLQNIARREPGVFILDYDALVSRHGRLSWQDERKWLTVRLPIAAHQLIHLANEWLRVLIPLTGKIAKALVVDLDNTLWGGVIGEDGMSGIKLGTEYPGAAYQALQRVMLDLAQRGILLAICSKNNSDDALEVLEKHPGMLLRPKNFSAMCINWNDKAQGLREIAAELNIGVDSLAFLDDNPFEREQLRGSLPEVCVIDLPEDPVQFAPTVRDCPVFERLTLSREDQQRTALYAQQRERSHAEHAFQSKEDFYRYLAQEAEVAPVAPATLARIAQLTQKTNQFNLTTRRYAEQQVSEMASRPDWQVLSIRVKDRFGDHGLVGVAITRDENSVCEIDTFLLSCRVIGRSVETALLSHLASGAKARGCKRVSGWFLPTKKNAPAKEFYRQHGFECQSQNGEGSLWVLDLNRQQIPCPDWIKLSVRNGEHS